MRWLGVAFVPDIQYFEKVIMKINTISRTVIISVAASLLAMTIFEFYVKPKLSEQ